MISPHTAPGTKVLCINDDPDAFLLPWVEYRKGATLDGLRSGNAYTICTIVTCASNKSGFIAVVAEIQRRDNWGFDLARFRYLHLPRSLTDLLETAPTRAPSELEPTQ